RRRWLAILGVTLTLLVSFSRLYLGVHYPGDVLGGLAIGLALVWLFNRLIGLEIGRDWPFAVKLTLAFLLPLAPLLFYRGPEAFKILGFLAGLLMGNLIEVRCLGFATGGGLAIQVRKVLLGYLVLVALKSLTSGVLPEGGLQALRYGLLSLWVTVVAPFVFLKLGWGSAVSCRLRPGD
ncbi:MAG: phosphatase PAP2 family protein, partial [Firmicutes bacterium]|nr:phosphatase PAP2 family protein [Bacillota bacterium]